jgi:hypothetical protein
MLLDITDYKFGCLGSPVDERDIYYSDIVGDTNTNIIIPDSFEIKYQFPPKNQGDVNSCIPHALSEYEEITKASNELFSVGFPYANRDVNQDYLGTGMILREALKHIVNEGNVLNKDFPVNEEYPAILDEINKYNKDDLYKKASLNKAKGYIRLNPEDVKRYMVTENKPIIMTIKVYDNIYDIKDNKGYIPEPIDNSKLLGGHCLMLTGYNGDIAKVLNSWGTIGDGGYLHLNINSSIIKELWVLTDESLYKPPMPPKGTVTPSNPVTPTNPTNVPTAETIYRVQLEADSIRSNADYLANELRSKGIDCCIKIYPTPKGNLYKVQVGAYKSYDNAIAMRDKMISLGYKDAYIADK